MAAITDEGIFNAIAILQPKLENRFRINALEGLSDEDNKALVIQTVSLSYREDRQTGKTIINWVIEEDCSGIASQAVEKIDKHRYLLVDNLDGAGTILSTIKFLALKVAAIDYTLDYASFNSSRFKLTLVSTGKVTRKNGEKNISKENNPT